MKGQHGLHKGLIEGRFLNKAEAQECEGLGNGHSGNEFCIPEIHGRCRVEALLKGRKGVNLVHEF